MHKLELEEQVMGRRAVSRCGYNVQVKSAAAVYEVGAASNYHALIAQSAHAAPDRSVLSTWCPSFKLPIRTPRQSYEVKQGNGPI